MKILLLCCSWVVDTSCELPRYVVTIKLLCEANSHIMDKQAEVLNNGGAPDMQDSAGCEEHLPAGAIVPSINQDNHRTVIHFFSKMELKVKITKSRRRLQGYKGYKCVTMHR
jgi:hypothetical protein